MSSSAASTRSRRSTSSAQPSWRTSKRQRAPTAVSLVSALPEAGSPLRSVLDQLPTIATNTLDSRAGELEREDHGRARSVDSAISGMHESPVQESAQDEQCDDQPIAGPSNAAPTSPVFTAEPPSMIQIDDHSPAVRLGSPPESEPSRSQPWTSQEQHSPQSLAPKPLSSSLVERIVSPMSSSSRLPWFGSFGRSKGAQLSASPTAEAEASSSIFVPTSVTAAPPATDDTRTTVSAPPATTAQHSRPSSAAPSIAAAPSTPVPFPISSSNTPTPKPSPPKPAPLDRVLSHASVISVDDEVPRLKLASPASPTAHTRSPSRGEVILRDEEERERGRTLSVTTLNPSTSRFSLKIPLLGRPKVPLEQAVASASSVGIGLSASGSASRETNMEVSPTALAPGKDTVVQPSVASLAVAGGSVTTESALSAAQELSSVAAADAESQPSAAPSQTSAADTASTSAISPTSTASMASPDRGRSPDSQRTPGGSWWGYIPWTGGIGEPEAQAAPALDSVVPLTASSVNSVPAADADSPSQNAGDTQVQADERAKMDGSPVQPATPAAPQPAGVTESSRQPASPASLLISLDDAPKEDKLIAPKPPSIISARSGGSAWYSPWAWYYGSSGEGQRAQDGKLIEGGGDGEVVKTESELVKERALARGEEWPGEQQAEQRDNGEAQPPTREASPVAQPPSPSPSRPAAARRPSAPGAPEATVTATHDAHEQNPLETSVTTQRSGWASFFMSRALLTKSVSDGTEGEGRGGMEVMDVPEEEEETPKAEREGKQQEVKSEPIAIAKDEGKEGEENNLARTAATSPKSLSSRVERLRTESSPTPPGARDNGKGDRKDKLKVKVRKGAESEQRSASPAPSATSTKPPSPPNLVLPGFEETFHRPPRSNVLPVPPKENTARGRLGRTLNIVGGALGLKDQGKGKGKGREREREGKEREFLLFGKGLPKAFDVLGEQLGPYLMNGGCRVVVIGVAGWTPGPVIRTIAGGLPSSSSKFVNYMHQSLERFEQEHGFKFKKITTMPLEGDGTIEQKVNKVHQCLLSNEDWLEDLHAADVIFVATHSQGSIISTHLIDRLIQDGHILTSHSVDVLARTAAAIAPGGTASVKATQAQRICFLALCGVHLGPLRYLKTSAFLQPYIQYFENAAASELFEFQNTESAVSKAYVNALSNILDHGAKVIYIASLNDQVVPIYSGIFSAASHPRILRALYIDGDAYSSSDFLTNLLILLVRVMNSGLSDGGLLNHLSEATAGSLNGVGHSTVYDEPETYSLAIKYFFLTNDGDTSSSASLSVQSFDAVVEQNDYEIPWSLRDMIADERVAYFFAQEFANLRDTFDDWQPKTSIMRDIKRKLQPIQRLSSIASHTTSKL